MSGFSAPPVNVLQAIAAAPAGSVGTYVFSKVSAANFGGFSSGEYLQPVSGFLGYTSGYGTAAFSGNQTLDGTWECMGKGNFQTFAPTDYDINGSPAQAFGATLYKRVE
jgi:hypothetical protein